MSPEVRAAIESATTVGVKRRAFYAVEQQRNHSADTVRAIVLAVVQELPSEMTMAELVDDLSIAANQVGDGEK